MEIDKIKNLDFLKGYFGIEKEVFRMTNLGDLSTQKHPFKYKWENPYFQVDFLESQLEIVTPKTNSLEKAFNFLKLQTKIVYEQLAKDETLLNYSLPLEYDEETFRITLPGISKKGREANKYRQYLLDKYGKQKMSISGIHFNFSFNDDFIIELAKINETDPINLKNELYFKGYQEYSMYFPVINYLFGSSPFVAEEYKKLFKDDKKTKKMIKHLRSFRNSKNGFPNNCHSLLDAKNYEEWTKSVDVLIKNSNIIGRQEIYQPIRMKTANKNRVDYLEIRNIDINPSADYGVNLRTLKFLHLFLVFLILRPKNEKKPEPMMTAQLYKETLVDGQAVAMGNESHAVVSKIKVILNEMKDFYKKLNREEKFLKEFFSKDIHPSHSIHKNLNTKEKIVKKMLQVKNFILSETVTAGFGDLELSTEILMKEALKNGILVDVVDDQKNLLKLSNSKIKWSTEYVIQATRTKFDSELSSILVNDKNISKNIMKESGITVPTGNAYSNKSLAEKAWDKFKNTDIVIKPNNANFSKGLTILKDNNSRAEYKEAIIKAFHHSDSILIENFVKGKEFRFLVIDGKVVGVLERKPANVIGDGKNSIEKLIQLKNENPLRGRGYKKPLEKIIVDRNVRNNLKKQKTSLSKKPDKDVVVWLRYNSNVSSGGDTIDVTTKTHMNHKKLAVQASKLFNLKIAGIDIVTVNHKIPGEATILEVNNNPAIHIHHHPLEGTSRNAALEILKLLELI